MELAFSTPANDQCHDLLTDPTLLIIHISKLLVQMPGAPSHFGELLFFNAVAETHIVYGRNKFITVREDMQFFERSHLWDVNCPWQLLTTQPDQPDL